MSHPFFLPPEWAPHAATWSVWPRDDAYWSGCLAIAQADLAGFLNTLAEFEQVRVLVHDEATKKEARSHLSDAITLHEIPNRDIWLRDSGPIFVQRDLPHDLSGNQAASADEAELAAVSWEFNAWGDRFPWELDNQIPDAMAKQLGLHLFYPGLILEGGSIDVNGTGLCLTTKQCLLTPSRNSHCSMAEIETALGQYLGITEVIWLDQGLEGDHTDGHVDTITRFVGECTVVTSVCTDPADANFEPMAANCRQLEAFCDRAGQPLRVIPLPLPQQQLDFQGERLPLTYANFYIANDVVLVPTYGDRNDELALEVLQEAFGEGQGDRTVIGLPARGLIHGGGAFHCATQQQPKGRFWSALE
ncbi:MAG: agmatine deiminase family protein [Synechococcales cyanobacterium CRU_2_2]|nr:agmatine deiminase family protein [Synechococcales cyanobacterium CRU_2_2]